jgi:hypothetical protein
MSFRNLNKGELLKAAQYFDVDVTENNTRQEIVAALEESEVSWSNYKKFVDNDDEGRWNDNGGSQTSEDKTSVPNSNAYETTPAAKVDSEGPASQAVHFDKMVLVKMERKNGTFEIMGRKFTRQQPFQVMSENEAQNIIDAAESMGGGFRIATPAEAKSYFG